MPALIANGVSIAISSDDPAMLGQNSAGLSYDFYQVIQAFDNIGLAGLVCQHLPDSCSLSKTVLIYINRELWPKTAFVGHSSKTCPTRIGRERSV